MAAESGMVSLSDSLPGEVHALAHLVDRAQQMKVVRSLAAGDSGAVDAAAVLPISKTLVVFKALEAYGFALQNKTHATAIMLRDETWSLGMDFVTGTHCICSERSACISAANKHESKRFWKPDSEATPDDSVVALLILVGPHNFLSHVPHCGECLEWFVNSPSFSPDTVFVSMLSESVIYARTLAEMLPLAADVDSLTDLELSSLSLDISAPARPHLDAHSLSEATLISILSEAQRASEEAARQAAAALFFHDKTILASASFAVGPTTTLSGDLLVLAHTKKTPAAITAIACYGRRALATGAQSSNCRHHGLCSCRARPSDFRVLS
jgi:hypothetical protein